MQTLKSILASLPFDLASRAYISSEEAAWSRKDALRVILVLESKGCRVLGVDIWLPTDPGPTIPRHFVYDWSSETHDVRFATAAQFIAGFEWDKEDVLNLGKEPYFNLTI